jgi:gamma-glutamyltranspeptidase/glutathione hydrolase
VVSHPLAAEAGAEMLRRGGNAVDAAAAVQFALNVVEPQFSGIGGGGFLMLYLASTGQTIALDGREMAPAADTPDQFLGPDGKPLPFALAHVQGTAVGVPGTLLNVATALERYGTIPLADTMQPAIDLAQNGFRINRFLASDIADAKAKLATWPATAAVFLPNGQPLAESAMLRQPDLAKTLRLIQQQGPSVLYQGEVGQALVAAQAQRSGRIAMADLASYEVKVRDPIVGTYRGYTVMSMAPPSSGGLTMTQMLEMLEPLDLRSKGQNTPEALHPMIEAMHLAYADRGKYMGDTDFVEVPMVGLLSPEYVATRRALIDPAQANPSVQPGDPWAYEAGAPTVYADVPGEEGTHTTHFTIVDGAGNIVAYTTTIEQAWGTGMMVPAYGFLLNNEMTDFDFVPGGPNQVAPGKRPRSSMNPTIVFRDGQPVFALGSPGGATIITTVMQVFLNVVEHQMALQDAIDAPRIFSSSYPSVTWEEGLDPATLDALTALGHKPAAMPTVIGSVQAALRGPDGEWTGGADHRREGTVIYVEQPLAPVPAGATGK